MKVLEKQLHEFDKDASNRISNQGRVLDQAAVGERKQKQVLYRELLNQQVQYNREMQGYGNMTDVEKKMNREDLYAYKNYDNNQYSMIPGVSSIKKV